MLTRREVLLQLKRVGVRTLSEMKRDCREFEQHMLVNYDYEISKKPEPRVKKLPRPRQPKSFSTPVRSTGKVAKRLVVTISGSFSSPGTVLAPNQFEKDPNPK